MGRVTFVALLFVMSLACIVIAIGERSFGWVVGAVVFFFASFYARKQFNIEEQTGHKGASFSFVGKPIILMLVVMLLLLFWIRHRV
jgi:hypothetical protein